MSVAEDASDAAWSFDTLAVRAGQERSQFNEHSEALYLTSSFVFESAAQAAARFSGTEPGNVYARFSNPTVSTMQERLAALEGAEACIATATGMAAILSTVMALMKSGEHIVSSRSIFGATQQLFGTILPRFGVDTSFVDQGTVEAFRAAMRPTTRLVFIETPSNPLTEVFDIAALAQVAHEGPPTTADHGRRPGDPFRHQVPRRAGAGARRRRLWRKGADRGSLQVPAHGRTDPVAVQCLDHPQGAGNAFGAHEGAIGQCA
jgi:hypothetical protein